MPSPIDADENDHDTSPKGLVRRLNRIAELVERANVRLERIGAGLADPPDPDKAALVAALSAILAQSAKTTKSATELLQRAR